MEQSAIIPELTVSENVTLLLFTSHETANVITFSRDNFSRKLHFVDKNSQTPVKKEILCNNHGIFRILIKQIQDGA